MTESNSTLVSNSCHVPSVDNCGPIVCDSCAGKGGDQVECYKICDSGKVITGVMNCPIEVLNIDFKASANRVLKNRPVKLMWTSDADSCEPDGSKGFFQITGSAPSGSMDITLVEDTTFGIICKKGEITDSREVTIKVNTVSIIEN
jgi:hypothetical protein